MVGGHVDRFVTSVKGAFLSVANLFGVEVLTLKRDLVNSDYLLFVDLISGVVKADGRF